MTLYAWFGMPSEPLKGEVQLHDWICSDLSPILREGKLEAVDRFSFFSCRISPDGCLSNEVSSQTQKVRLVLVSSRLLCHQPNIRLSIRGRVYTAALRSV